MNMMMDFQKQLREQQERTDARMEKMQQQQQQYMQSMMMMMMMMMMGIGGYPQTAIALFLSLLTTSLIIIANAGSRGDAKYETEHLHFHSACGI